MPMSSDPFETVTRTVREEPLLWPVATVAWLIFCTFGGFVLFYAVWLRSLVAGVALLFALFFTVYGFDADIRAKRLQPRSVLVLSLWIGSALAGFGLDALGV
jgi:hypothetical protein